MLNQEQQKVLDEIRRIFPIGCTIRDKDGDCALIESHELHEEKYEDYNGLPGIRPSAYCEEISFFYRTTGSRNVDVYLYKNSKFSTVIDLPSKRNFFKLLNLIS